MTRPPEDARHELRREVDMLLGRCVLRLQIYEELIKALLVDREISGPVVCLQQARAARVEEFRRRTLGTLVQELIGTHFVTGEDDMSFEDEAGPTDKAASVRMSFNLGMSEADLARTADGLRELVLIRNNLVHQFISQHDLGSIDGCQGAKEALEAIMIRIDHHYRNLKFWAECLSKAYKETADLMNSEIFWDIIINGIHPDGTVFWPNAGIVYALHAASEDLAVDGWTSVAKAEAWIAERDPTQTPVRYRCKTLKEAIDKSKSFDIRYFNIENKKTAFYRPRRSSQSE